MNDAGPDEPDAGDGGATCVDPAIDCPLPPACSAYVCSAEGTCRAEPNGSLDGTDCGGGGHCASGECAVCGNGSVENGEDCEPPGTASCDSSCLAIACGDGVRQSGETCDDSNTKNLDGCSASCQFEQVHRVRYLEAAATAGAFCGANQFGGAFGVGARFGLQTVINMGLASGQISMLFVFAELDDLSGSSDPALSLGVVSATPVADPSYDGTTDLDWWHVIEPSDLDVDRAPLRTLSGSLSNSVLEAGPGRIVLGLNALGALTLSNARVQLSVGASSTPLSSSGSTPGHLPAANLDPALTSFETMAEPTASDAGRLCGNIGAASLAQVPIPAAYVGAACSLMYTAESTLLDLLVGGCDNWLNSVTPTQPDQVDAANAQPGDGGPYELTLSAATKRVATCRDVNDQAVDLATCLNAAAYSSEFFIATGRVVPR